MKISNIKKISWLNLEFQLLSKSSLFQNYDFSFVKFIYFIIHLSKPIIAIEKIKTVEKKKAIKI